MHFISEVMGHHSVDFTRRVYAKFSPESASRAVLRALEGDQNGTNLAHVA
jgi:integrase